MRINYRLKTAQKGDKVKIKKYRGKDLTKLQKRELLDYNIEHFLRKGFEEKNLEFTVIDTNSVYQPNLSIDLPGIKIYHPVTQYWVLPKWALKIEHEN